MLCKPVIFTLDLITSCSYLEFYYFSVGMIKQASVNRDVSPIKKKILLWGREALFDTQ